MVRTQAKLSPVVLFGSVFGLVLAVILAFEDKKTRVLTAVQSTGTDSTPTLMIESLRSQPQDSPQAESFNAQTLVQSSVTSALQSPASAHGNLTVEEVIQAVESTWPEDSDRARRIVLCESGAGFDPNAWLVSRPDGGPMQINKSTWADYFNDTHGWTWAQIVLDLEIHLAAAREIYHKTGGWHPWACSDVTLPS